MAKAKSSTTESTHDIYVETSAYFTYNNKKLETYEYGWGVIIRDNATNTWYAQKGWKNYPVTARRSNFWYHIDILAEVFSKFQLPKGAKPTLFFLHTSASTNPDVKEFAKNMGFSLDCKAKKTAKGFKCAKRLADIGLWELKNNKVDPDFDQFMKVNELQPINFNTPTESEDGKSETPALESSGNNVQPTANIQTEVDEAATPNQSEETSPTIPKVKVITHQRSTKTTKKVEPVVAKPKAKPHSEEPRPVATATAVMEMANQFDDDVIDLDCLSNSIEIEPADNSSLVSGAEIETVNVQYGGATYTFKGECYLDLSCSSTKQKSSIHINAYRVESDTGVRHFVVTKKQSTASDSSADATKILYFAEIEQVEPYYWLMAHIQEVQELFNCNFDNFRDKLITQFCEFNDKKSVTPKVGIR